MTHIVHVMDSGGYRTVTDLAEVSALLGRSGITLWIDSDGRSPTLENFLQNTLNLHPLVIEDIFSDRLTPKIEDFDEFLYIVMHGVRRNGDNPEALATIELDVVVGSNWVFTHHALSLQPIDDLTDEFKRNTRVLAKGAAFVAHALIDKLTDYYLPVVDNLDDEIGELEKIVVEAPGPECMQQLFAMKRSIQKLRRVAVYQREILLRLSRGEFDLIPPPVLPFFRDVYDHFVRISDLADSYRDLIGAALEMYMSVTANRTNEIMKVLAIISTVMLPLTFIAGLYGMNFEHMPEIHWYYGYPMALLLMALVALGFVVWFRHRRWI